MIGSKYLDLKHPKNYFKNFVLQKEITRKIKEFTKISNKVIYFTLQSRYIDYPLLCVLCDLSNKFLN